MKTTRQKEFIKSHLTSKAEPENAWSAVTDAVTFFLKILFGEFGLFSQTDTT